MARDNTAPTAAMPNTATTGPCVSRCVEDLKREFVKTSYLAMVPGLVVVLGQLTVGSSATIPGFVLALFSGVCVFGFFVILARRKYIPAIEMMVWTGDRHAEILAEIDGNRESPDGDELLLERLAGRTGSEASFLRIGALSGLGRADEARALLDAWQPTIPSMYLAASGWPPRSTSTMRTNTWRAQQQRSQRSQTRRSAFPSRPRSCWMPHVSAGMRRGQVWTRLPPGGPNSGVSTPHPSL